MPENNSMLVTSEMMAEGMEPLLFTGGACNIQDVGGPVRNPGRDRLHAWLDEQRHSYFEPQIHPTLAEVPTLAAHGRRRDEQEAKQHQDRTYSHPVLR